MPQIRKELTMESKTLCAVMHVHGPTLDEKGRMCLGHCPHCHQAVWDDENITWDCPANLPEGNPHRTESYVSAELQEARGIYSNCAHDFFLPCGYQDMPIHDACRQD